MQEILGIAINFGLVVLIWMVQLIIYPSFLYYETKNLVIWHQKYTGQITIIVAPLMFAQLGLSVLEAYSNLAALSIAQLSLVIFAWFFTFVFFVLTHNKLSEGQASKPIL